MKVLYTAVIAILIYTTIYCEVKKQELIKVVIKIGASQHTSYIQLSSREKPKSFKIIKREV